MWRDKKGSAVQFPDFSNKSVIDKHMTELDTHGVSRREFLRFASAAAVAATGAAAMGRPTMAMADPGGKLAYLSGYMGNEWNQLTSRGVQEACDALGFQYSVFDSGLSAVRQSGQFEQQMVEGSKGILLNLSDGGSIRRFAQQAQQSGTFIANIWDTQPWFTPFDASEYWTLYAQPNSFEATRLATRKMCQQIIDTFGGGKIAGVTGNEGSTLDIEISAGRDAAIAEFPEIEFVGSLPGLWTREPSLKAAEAMLNRHPDIRGFVTQNDDVALGTLAALRIKGLQAGKDVLVLSGTDGTSEAARQIKRGAMFMTCANPGTYVGGMFAARLYDVSHGFEPTDSERLLTWTAEHVDSSNVDAYIARYVDNTGPTNDYRKMSRVLHPDDWDPQNEVRPFDLDVSWGHLPGRADYSYPERYLKAKENGEWEAITKLYADHYKIKFFDPLPV